MKKTNFKCMYLIDDMLYKKTVIPNNIYDLNHNNKINSIDFKLQENLAQPKTNSLNIEDTVSNIAPPPSSNHMKISSMDKCQCNSTKNNETNLKFVDNISQQQTNNINDINTDTHIESALPDHLPDISSEDECQCMEIDEINDEKQKTKIFLPESITNRSEITRKVNRKKYLKKKLNKYESNDKIDKIQSADDELLGLQERLNRIRYDVEWPPRKSPAQNPQESQKPLEKKLHKYVGRSHHDIIEKMGQSKDEVENVVRCNISNLVGQFSRIENENEKILYICTLCDSNFNRKNSLTRHMKNIHHDFFINLKKKKRKLSENQFIPNKKLKNDISRKRKYRSNINPNNKKSKKEVLCSFCGLYFKTNLSLKRHENNIHDFQNDNAKGIKRKGNCEIMNDERYIKRHKNETKIPVTYQNYF